MIGIADRLLPAAIGALGGVGTSTWRCASPTSASGTGTSETSAYWMFLASYVVGADSDVDAVCSPAGARYRACRESMLEAEPAQSVIDSRNEGQCVSNCLVTQRKCPGHTQVDMAQPKSAPLTGYRVAVTSARRSEEAVLLR